MICLQSQIRLSAIIPQTFQLASLGRILIKGRGRWEKGREKERLYLPFLLPWVTGVKGCCASLRESSYSQAFLFGVLRSALWLLKVCPFGDGWRISLLLIMGFSDSWPDSIWSATEVEPHCSSGGDSSNGCSNDYFRGGKRAGIWFRSFIAGIGRLFVKVLEGISESGGLEGG